jgi:uncharacterized phosphosugar-binding protein
MSAKDYFDQADRIAAAIRNTQIKAIRAAASRMAESVASGGWVYLFGSGHSIIPVLDVFPRYGSFVGFRPLMDPRLMWFNVIGPGGAPELLWLERQPGYVQNFLQSFEITSKDTMLVFSHGGLNAAPIEASEWARQSGAFVIAVTSLQNRDLPEHRDRRHLSAAADLTIDNCVPPEDALVDFGQTEKAGAGSTLAVTVIAMALVCETAAMLKQRGVDLDVFVSPNVPGVAPDHNQRVFEKFKERLRCGR